MFVRHGPTYDILFKTVVGLTGVVIGFGIPYLVTKSIIFVLEVIG